MLTEHAWCRPPVAGRGKRSEGALRQLRVPTGSVAGMTFPRPTDSAHAVEGPQVDRAVPLRIHPMGWVAALVVPLGIVLGWPGAAAWLVLTGVVAVHELGHAAAAWRFRYPIEELAVGVGPRLVDLRVRGVPVVVRALPVIGWVVAACSQDRGGHRRRACFSAAGPAASVAAGLLLGVVASVVTSGPTALRPAELTKDAAWTLEVATATPRAFVSPLIDLVTPKPASATTPTEPAPATDADQEEDELQSIIGVTAALSDDVEVHGLRAALVWAAALSASVGGLNLLPVYGLDGFGIVSSALDGIRSRHRRLGSILRVIVTFVAVVGLAALAFAVVRLLLIDLIGG